MAQTIMHRQPTRPHLLSRQPAHPIPVPSLDACKVTSTPSAQILAANPRAYGDEAKIREAERITPNTIPHPALNLVHPSFGERRDDTMHFHSALATHIPTNDKTTHNKTCPTTPCEVTDKLDCHFEQYDIKSMTLTPSSQIMSST